jgi:PQQ-dependent dehydrogenase (methanol/ethanol family)
VTPNGRPLALAVVAVLAACGERPAPHTVAQGGGEHLSGRLVLSGEPAAGEWRTVAGDLANTRYSTLSEIDAGNVGRLKVAWTWATGIPRGHEAAPLVVGDTMYAALPFPNALVALDVRTGHVRWTHDPAPDPAAQGVACCDLVNRGAAYADGRVFWNTLDAYTVAVDAGTGKLLWKTKLGEIARGESITMAPVVVKGKVLVGNSGGEFGVRGWIAALDAKTGKEAWRAWSTGPDADVKIGGSFRPFYPGDRGTDLGVKTWPPDRWKIGGGNVWGFLSYDPALDLVFHGTGNPGSWNPEMRPGDNKWTAGIFARRPETGEAVWYYQWSPHDLYDHDGVNENVLVDLEPEGGGARRRLLLHPDRNGFLYVVDREKGQVLSADPFVHVTVTTKVDLATGRPEHVRALQPGFGRTVRGVCPASTGGKDWQPSAFSPRTGLLYVPHQNICEDVEGTEASYIAGTPYVGANVKMYGAPGKSRGELTAWDPIARTARWSVAEDFPVWSGALVTAGDVLFYGTMDGWFKALDARTGKEVWRHQMPSGVVGQPVTYRAPDGKQHVAVFAGLGGWPGAIVAVAVDGRDPTAGNGWVTALPDLPGAGRLGGVLFDFCLP